MPWPSPGTLMGGLLLLLFLLVLHCSYGELVHHPFVLMPLLMAAGSAPAVCPYMYAWVLACCFSVCNAVDH